MLMKMVRYDDNVSDPGNMVNTLVQWNFIIYANATLPKKKLNVPFFSTLFQ